VGGVSAAAALWAALAGLALLPQTPPPPASSPASAPYRIGGRCAPGTPAGRQGIHRPSPDWARQIIYSVQLDRFNDGDKSRNDQGQGEYDPTQDSHYSGGDIAGLIDRLDYLRALGVTTVLLSPFIANKWVDPGFGGFPPYTGYHGYWPVSFEAIDAHLGSVADLRRLSRALHARGMYLLMDVVANHSAHYYHFTGPYDPADPTRNFAMLAGQSPPRPLMPPFDLNDVRRPADRAADIYHWTPPITDYLDPKQIERYQLELVNDLNTSNPAVRHALKSAYRCWLREIGFDGIRIDAAKHVERDFWADFLYAPDGLLAEARRWGKRDLLSYGEIWNISPPFEDSGERAVAGYIETGQHNGFATAMGFPFFSNLNKVINNGRPTDILAYTLEAQMRRYPRPERVINFLDSHDASRFLAAGDPVRLRKALALLMTVPGIPLLYQGDEQGFTEQRRAMFAGGFGSTRDQFDQGAPLFRTVKALAALRRGSGDLFTHGGFRALNSNPLGPGVFAFERRLGARAAFVIVNTGRSATLVNALPTGLPAGTRLDLAYADGLPPRAFTVGAKGTLTFALPGDAVAVLRPSPSKRPGPSPRAARLALDQPAPSGVLHTDQRLAGHAPPGARVQLVIDGDLGRAITTVAGADGGFALTLPVRELAEQAHFFELWLPDHGIALPPSRYSADRPAERSARVADPVGDDHGPDGRYALPTHPSFAGRMDLIGVAASVGGDQLVITFDMAARSDAWSYPNGFENVAFHIFFDDHRPGAATGALPWIDAPAPSGFAWRAAQLLHGFGNALYRPGAKGPEEVAGAAPRIEATGTRLRLRYDCRRLPIDCRAPLSLYVTTWDREQNGTLRGVSAAAETWRFGHEGSPTPRIIDDARIDLAR